MLLTNLHCILIYQQLKEMDELGEKVAGLMFLKKEFKEQTEKLADISATQTRQAARTEEFVTSTTNKMEAVEQATKVVQLQVPLILAIKVCNFFSFIAIVLFNQIKVREQ